ncbi:bestrophin family ion channel [Rhabdobacter roseus]|uniref:Putative membrane protein n=1 Tax=Rhabdobacter roseus TaxID=1655419 RepID=A0A840TVF5_9BACT|nr:bestrophin family ion channel [Rhabdobacter roseus]MBB5283649.1 putative membrane protein [Rhabdobacter roseus]
MIEYNPKEWFRFIFFFHKADTVRKLGPLLLTIAAYSTILAFLIIDVWKIGQDTDLKNVSLMHSLLGFVISMLLVFRTNTAYDRWWEGRKQWGSLVNCSRNLALKINGLLGPEQIEARAFFRIMIPNFAFALKNHLRGTFSPQEFQNAPAFGLEDVVVQEHVPNQVASTLFARAIELQKQGVLLPEHMLLINYELAAFTNISGACERIKNTPIPFSYSSFLKKFVFLYCITLPIGYVFSLHYLVIPFVVFVFYILASLEVIAEEIEDPFGTDANDLPTDKICGGIRTTVHDLLK